MKTLISQNVSMPMFAAATALAVFSFAFVALSPSICAALRSAKMASSNTWVRYGTLDESAEHGHLHRASANEVKRSIVGLLFFFAAWRIRRRSAPARVPGRCSTGNEFDAPDSL